LVHSIFSNSKICCGFAILTPSLLNNSAAAAQSVFEQDLADFSIARFYLINLVSNSG